MISVKSWTGAVLKPYQSYTLIKSTAWLLNVVFLPLTTGGNPNAHHHHTHTLFAQHCGPDFWCSGRLKGLTQMPASQAWKKGCLGTVVGAPRIHLT